jgi:hypothetical protein
MTNFDRKTELQIADLTQRINFMAVMKGQSDPKVMRLKIKLAKLRGF